jgi:hypothetical protein
MRGMVGDESHYWNRVNGEDIDLTREQFPDFTVSDVRVASRDYVLSYPETRRRYELLREAVETEDVS